MPENLSPPNKKLSTLPFSESMARAPLLIILAFACSHCSAQRYTTAETAAKKTAKDYADAIELRNSGQIPKAIEKLENIVKSDPQFIEAPNALGGMYYENGDLIASAQAFEKVIALDTFYAPRVMYSLGRIYMRTGEFTKARQLLQHYLEHGIPEGEHKANTEEYLQRAETAEYLVQHPVNFEPELLPGPVNSNADEVLPAFTVDGAYMFFTRRAGQEDLYIARWDSVSRTWVEPLGLDAINTSHNEGAHAVSADGSMIAFTACGRSDGLGSCDLYFWQRRNGVWQTPVNAGGINWKGWDAQPALTADGRGLYFSSDRPGGIGGTDIWYTERHGDRWTLPVNLGTPVNTSGNEESPFLFFDSRTLYFMSDGHHGIGDFDLFVTSKTGKSWSVPKNLGYPINTPGSEGALAIHPDREYAYFTSDRDGGQNDIYRFKLDSTLLPPPVSNLKGSVSDAITGTSVIAEVAIYDLADSTELYHYTTDDMGVFSAVIVHGHVYGVHVSAPNYAFWSDQIHYSSKAPYGQKKIHIPLIPLKKETPSEKETPVVLRNIQFETGSAALLKSSTPELNRLLVLLIENPDIQIELRGHTDNVGTAEDNQALSEARARAVYDWLITKGIDTFRLSYLGFGETLPVASNETGQGRQENRRTEFVIRN